MIHKKWSERKEREGWHWIKFCKGTMGEFLSLKTLALLSNQLGSVFRWKPKYVLGWNDLIDAVKHFTNKNGPEDYWTVWSKCTSRRDKTPSKIWFLSHVNADVFESTGQDHRGWKCANLYPLTCGHYLQEIAFCSLQLASSMTKRWNEQVDAAFQSPISLQFPSCTGLHRKSYVIALHHTCKSVSTPKVVWS